MQKRLLIVLISATITACSGGGGQSSGVPPALPLDHANGAMALTFVIPPASKQSTYRQPFHGHVARPLWDSPSALGAGINYAASVSALGSPNTPQAAFNFATACTAANDCSQNADGTRSYTVTIPIPNGTYALEVTEWDQPPSGTSFPASANELSQGVGSVTINGTTPINLSLNGIPASVVLVPAPGQSHVQPPPAPFPVHGALRHRTFGGYTSSGYTIVGNGPTQWFAEALDADGNLITGNGAPAITFTQPSGSPYLAISSSTQGPQNLYTFRALQATLATAATPPTASFNLAVNATNGASPPVTLASTTVPITTEQELWVSENAGSGLLGLSGWPLNPVSTYATLAQPFDFAPIPSTSNNTLMAIDSKGNFWTYETSVSPPAVAEFAQVGGSQPPQPATGIFTDTGVTIDGLVGDGSGNIWVLDNASPYGTLRSYNVANAGSGGVTAGPDYSFTSSDAARSPSSVTIAPSGYVWVAGSTTSLQVFPPTALTSSTTVAIPALSPALTSISSIAFGPDGTLWVCGTNTASIQTLAAFTLSGSASSPTLTSAGSPATNVTCNAEMAATAQQSVWIPQLGFEIAVEYAVQSGAVIPTSNIVNVQATAYGDVIAP
jgi:hypothetical protein